MSTILDAVRDTIHRTRNGVHPYQGGPFDGHKMQEVSDEFSHQVKHDPFVAQIKASLERGEDISERLADYMSIVFAEGFSAGWRYETLRNLGEK